MVNDDRRFTDIADLENARSRRRLTNTLNNLLDEAVKGTLRCAAIRMYYKDGTNEVKVIGGTLEEQAEALARLEAEEAKGGALMEELRPIVNEVFSHLPDEERDRVLESPERMRPAFNTLSHNQRAELNPLIWEQWTKYKIFWRSYYQRRETKQDGHLVTYLKCHFAITPTPPHHSQPLPVRATLSPHFRRAANRSVLRSSCLGE